MAKVYKPQIVGISELIPPEHNATLKIQSVYNGGQGLKNKMVEEMGEAIVAITRTTTKTKEIPADKLREEMAEELADVIITITQFVQLAYSRELVEQALKKKLAKLARYQTASEYQVVKQYLENLEG